jgi:hypothetical protein
MRTSCQIPGALSDIGKLYAWYVMEKLSLVRKPHAPVYLGDPAVP